MYTYLQVDFFVVEFNEFKFMRLYLVIVTLLTNDYRYVQTFVVKMNKRVNLISIKLQ